MSAILATKGEIIYLPPDLTSRINLITPNGIPLTILPCDPEAIHSTITCNRLPLVGDKVIMTGSGFVSTVEANNRVITLGAGGRFAFIDGEGQPKIIIADGSGFGAYMYKTNNYPDICFNDKINLGKFLPSKTEIKVRNGLVRIS